MPFIYEQLSADGSTQLGRIVWTKALLDIIQNDHVVGAAVNSGGTGYVVGETFDIDGGTAVSGFIARGEVLAVSAGVVTAVRVTSCGAYSTLPGVTGQTTSNASASGSGLTLNLTTQVALWVIDEEDYTNPTTDFEFLAHSTKSTNPPYIGFQSSYALGGSSRGRVQAATGYNAMANFVGQPGASPDGANQAPCFNHQESDPVIFAAISDRRIIAVVADPPRYQLVYVGLFVPFSDDPASNYPLPLIVGGTCVSTAFSAISGTFWEGSSGTDIRNIHSSIAHPGGNGDTGPTDNCPYWIRDNLSPSWLNLDDTGAQNLAEHFMWPNFYDANHFTFAPQVDSKSTDPVGQQTSTSQSEDWFDDDNASDANGVPGVAVGLPTGGRSHFPVVCQIIKNQPNNVNVVGYMEGLYLVHGRGLTEEDRIVDLNGDYYICFPDIGGAPISKWIAVKEL